VTPTTTLSAIVLYLNGVELLRDNLPSQTITPSTPATTSISGAGELAWQSFIVPSTALLSGTNVIAVEVHQPEPSSSDLGFDLRLSGVAQASIGYSEWQRAIFGSDHVNPAIADEFADPDSDSHRNLMEYGLGAEPTVIDPGQLTSGDVGSGRLALQFSRNSLATDVTLTVQGSDDVSGPWSDLARSSSGNPFEPLTPSVTVLETASGPIRAVEVRDIFSIQDPAHPRRFLRLQITR